MEQHHVIIDTQACVGCGLCARICVAHNLVIAEQKASLRSDACILCGQCTAVCPKSAVAISGYGPGRPAPQAEVRLKPEEVLDVIRFRRSIRHFRDTPVPAEAVGQILEAGRLTHTAKNMQDVSFVVLDQEKSRMEQMAVQLFRKLKPLVGLTSPLVRRSEIDDHFFFFHAPLVLVILAEAEINGVLAAQNMEFVAEAHGLGVLFSGYFTRAVNLSRKLQRVLGVPKGKQAAATLVLGYPDVTFLRSPPRKALDVTYL